jgi:transposase
VSRKIRIVALSAEALLLLKEGYSKGKSHAFRKRCHIVLLKGEGRTSKDIGLIVSLHEISVNHWLNRYEAAGIKGLFTQPGRGRKAILDEQRDGATVRTAVTQERQRLSVAKALLEEQLHKSFSTKTLKRFLKSVTAATNA